jgi:YfiH family protein
MKTAIKSTQSEPRKEKTAITVTPPERLGAVASGGGGIGEPGAFMDGIVALTRPASSLTGIVVNRYHQVVTGAIAVKKLQLLHSPQLEKLPWLVHAFTTRHGGVSRVYGGRALNLGFTSHDSRAAVERNRGLLLKKLGVAGRVSWPLVTLRQIHSDLIHCVDAAPAQLLAGDGLITDTPGLLLGVQAADCIPIIVVDRKRRAVGVFHAGWRGTVKRIVEKGVGEMRRHFGSDPRNMLAAIGPGIRSCCYEVGEEVRTRFESQFAYAASLFSEVKESDPVREKYPLLFLTARAPGHSELPVKIFLDLVEANRRQLMDAGLAEKNIDASAPCTSCHTDVLFSHRGDKGVTGRMMAVAGIRPR